MDPVRQVRETAAATMRALAIRLPAPVHLLPSLSVRQLLATLVLLTAVPLLAFALLISSSMMATERQAHRSVMMTNARILASLIDNEIDTHLALAQTLATSPSLQTGDIVAFRQQALKALAVVPGTWIVLSEPSGRNVMSTLLQDGEPAPPRNSLDFSKQVWASGQPQVSDVVMGSMTKRLNAILEVPVFKDGKPLYSIIVGLNPDRFLAILRNSYSPDSVVGLLDRKANFVARIPDHAARVGTPASDRWRAAIARSPDGLVETTTLEGELSITPYVTTKYGWTVGIAYLDRVIAAPVRRLLWTLGLIGGILTLISLTVGIGVARRISASMQSIVDASRNMAEGKTVAARALAVHEATEISRTLSVTSEILATRTADLRSAHDTFLNLIEHAPFGIYVVDSDLRIVQISNGAENAFANVQPVLGRDFAEVMRAIWPEGFAEEAIGRFRHTLETGEPYHQSSLEETRLDTGDDEAYDWQIERVTLPDGKLGVVCYYYDLSALKKAQSNLRDSEARYRLAIQSGGLGTWENDIESGQRLWSPEAMAIFGLDLADGIGRCVGDDDELYSRLHPDDLHVRERYRRDLRDTGSITAEYRIVLPNGAIRWLAGGGMVLTRNSAGDPVKSVHITADITARKEAEAALRESEIRFRQTFENAAVGVAHVGLDGHWLEVNQTLCDILGYSREELQSKSFQEITHPDDLNADVENARCLMADQIQKYGMDKRYIRKDGTIIWCGLTVALRRDTTGAPLYFIAIVRDIRERKAAQAHQQFLLGELAHRMKNQLAVIQAVAGQTARNAGSLKQFQEQFSQRVQGLAVATDLLIAQGWSGAQLKELIRRQLKPFVPSADRLECDGPNVTISADATQTIGLALHELATNAVKHGAWSSTGGRVKVSWQFVTNGATGNNLRVTWVELDGPVVVSPTRKGFGHVVVESMAAQRVGGEAQLEFAPEGLSWRLTMPNSHILADAGTLRGPAALLNPKAS